jgi:hypothetical protein
MLINVTEKIEEIAKQHKNFEAEKIGCLDLLKRGGSWKDNCHS